MRVHDQGVSTGKRGVRGLFADQMHYYRSISRPDVELNEYYLLPGAEEELSSLKWDYEVGS